MLKGITSNECTSICHFCRVLVSFDTKWDQCKVPWPTYPFLVVILIGFNGVLSISTMGIIYHYCIQICSPLKVDSSIITGFINIIWNILAAVNIIAI